MFFFLPLPFPALLSRDLRNTRELTRRDTRTCKYLVLSSAVLKTEGTVSSMFNSFFGPVFKEKRNTQNTTFWLSSEVIYGVGILFNENSCRFRSVFFFIQYSLIIHIVIWLSSPPPAVRALIGYFEVTWHLTVHCLPANVNRRPPLLLLPLHVFRFVLSNKSLNDWSLGKQFILFPSNLNVSPRRSRGKHWDSRERKWTVSLGTSH